MGAFGVLPSCMERRCLWWDKRRWMSCSKICPKRPIYLFLVLDGNTASFCFGGTGMVEIVFFWWQSIASFTWRDGFRVPINFLSGSRFDVSQEMGIFYRYIHTLCDI